MCLNHIPQIKESLRIGGIETNEFAWRTTGADKGAQIDLIISRKDGVINLCEMKYSRDVFAIDKDYDNILGRKAATFAGVTKTRKAVHQTMVTANGLMKNGYSSRIQSEVSLQDLFQSS